jgi:hypothetical protein
MKDLKLSISSTLYRFKNLSSKNRTPSVQLKKGPVTTKSNLSRTIKIQTPDRKVSYKVVGPSKVRNTLDNSVKLV